MELTWHPAKPGDIKLLTKVRIDILRAEQNKEESADMSDILVQTYEYYKEVLQNDRITSYLVFAGEEVVGTGDLCITRVLPTQENPTGYQAQIMNVYTHPEYRRQGIAYRTVALLLAEAERRGISALTLDPTEMSRPLFEKFGFTGTDHMHPQVLDLYPEEETPSEQPQNEMDESQITAESLVKEFETAEKPSSESSFEQIIALASETNM
jgi:GNAT superfamily N-acetyltransferase